MITNVDLHRRMDEEERWETLRRMTPEESISLGEALLTSEVMRDAAVARDDRPVCLAVALGIRRRYVENSPRDARGS